MNMSERRMEGTKMIFTKKEIGNGGMLRTFVFGSVVVCVIFHNTHTTSDNEFVKCNLPKIQWEVTYRNFKTNTYDRGVGSTRKEAFSLLREYLNGKEQK